MYKKNLLLYFNNLFIAFVVLFVLLILFTGCSTAKDTINKAAYPPKVPSAGIESLPQVPIGYIDTPPTIHTPSLQPFGQFRNTATGTS